MDFRLAEILAEKRKEVDKLKKRGVLSNGCKDMPFSRNFKDAISKINRIGLIAEIKFVSPSAGVIREKGEPISIGRIYEEAGAAAISVLTDKKFFGGDVGLLPRLKRGISLPILRKDFVIDEIQVIESFLYGADAILLITRILSSKQLKRLLGTCHELGLTPLTEVHDKDELQKAMECGADIIGINNRNLDTFEIDFNTSLKLAPLVPDNHIVVSESGIRRREDVLLLKHVGVQAILVGTVLMKSQDIRAKTIELTKACIRNGGKGGQG